MTSGLRAVAVLVLAGGASAQSTLWELPGSYDAGYGATLAVLGDVTGDGLDDVAIGLLEADKVRVRDGADGSFLYTVGGQPGSHFSESLVSLGDLDGDGTPDLGVGAPRADFAGLSNAGEFRVLSGLDGSLIRKHQGGASELYVGGSAVALGDIDLDGVSDYAFRRQPGSVGELAIRSGATGQTLEVLTGFDAFDDFGRELAAGGDIDQDGVGDLVVLAPNVQPAPTVTAFSGAALGQSEQELLYHVSLLGVFGQISLAMPGDLDGDGGADVAVGAEHVIRVIDSQGLFQDALAGAPYGGMEFARRIAAAGDLDGDGVGDLLATGADGNLPGVGELHFVSAVSGADGHVLFSSVGSGWVFALAAGDFDGDDRRDVVASYRDFVLGGEHTAVVRAVPGSAGSLEAVGASCYPQSTVPFGLAVVGDPSPGGRLIVVAAGPPALTVAPSLLLVGVPGAPLGLPGGCALHVGPLALTVPLAFPVFSPQVGLAFDVPPTVTDLPLGVQAVALDGNGAVVTSNGAFVTIKG